MLYDVVVIGGSISGLLCAREIAKSGNHVLVIEEDSEIGTPEHCGGLVSMSALQELGIIPFKKTFDHLIEQAVIYSPNGKRLTINSQKQQIAEISRRELDKQIAHQAQKNGAEIKVRTSFQEFIKDGVRTNDGEIKCKIVVDARGISSLIHKDRTGVINSAQFEIFAPWIRKGVVEIYFDQDKFPGFFAWVIPSDEGKGKVGVAGKGINAAEALNEFLKDKGKFSTIRKIFAPIWIKGPIDKFVSGNVVVVGDAAGQSKPTTAGGILSCGLGGILAGQSISNYLKSGNAKDLEEYQNKWTKKFGKEFTKQSIARKFLESIDNDKVNQLFETINPETIKDISEKGNFDFHTSSIFRLLGVKGTIKTASLLMTDQLKKILN